MSDRKKSRQIDMVGGPLGSSLVRFTLPVAFAAILGQALNITDIAVVGNCCGEASTSAVAAVGANGPIVSLVVNCFTGLSLGLNVVAAVALGNGRKADAENALTTALRVGVVCGVAVAALGVAVAEPALRMLSVPESVFSLALWYFRLYVLGAPAILLYNLQAAVFRSMGDAKTPLAALACSCVLNAVLDLAFVLGLGLSAEGVALATTISNYASALILFVRLRSNACSLDVRSGRFNGRLLVQVLKIGVPAAVQSAVFAVSNLVIQGAINGLGEEVMAASAAALNVEVLVYFLYASYSQACTTFVGRNRGAGNIARCKRVLKLCLMQGFVVTFCAIGVMLLIGHAALSCFVSDPGVIELGYLRLMLVFCSYPFGVIYEIMGGYLRGFGVSATPAVISIVGVCGVRIAWILLVFSAAPSFGLLMTSYPVSMAVTATLMLVTLLILRPAKHFHPER